MTEDHRIICRLDLLERRVRRLLVLVVILSTGLLAAAAQPGADVLRAKGLVIVDAQGRERIILGAPLAEATTDARLATAAGMAILDSAGRMAVSVGAGSPLINPDGTVGTRIAGENGVIFYDPRSGQERGGFGAFDDGRANICLDYEGHKEAVCMTVASGDEYTAVLLNGTPGQEEFDRVAMFVGADGTGVVKAMGSGAQRGGVVMKSGPGSGQVLLIDSTMNVVRDLAKP